MKLNLEDLTFDEFIDFIFDHPVPSDGEVQWYFREELDEITFEPRAQLERLRRLFSRPEVVRNRYSPDQINQGFWFIFGCEGERFCADLLFDPALPWLLRKSCIDSIAELYERLFLFGDCASACWMLWDLLAHDFEAGRRNPQDNPDHARIQDAMFEALRPILALPDPECQRAAPHGLFHLAHRNGPELIRQFIAQGVDPEVRTYAEKVLAGDAM